jgi:hypothetical protein
MVIARLTAARKLSTSYTGYRPIKHLQMMGFDATRWTPFGAVIEAAR